MYNKSIRPESYDPSLKATYFHLFPLIFHALLCVGVAEESSSVTVPPETMTTMLTCLQNYIGYVKLIKFATIFIGI